MYDVITVGSATIDCFVNTGKKLFRILHKDHGDIVFVPFGSKITVEDLYFQTGGGGTNTAVSIARLGLNTAYIGKLGGDQSKMVYEALRREKVDTSLIVKGRDVGFSVILDAKGHDRTILTHKGSNNMLDFSEVKKSKLQAKWFYMASMVGKSYKTLIKIADYANKKGIKVAFNPSSYITIQGYKKLSQMLKRTDLLIVNREEAEELLGKRLPMEQMLIKLRKMVRDMVIITDGRQGCYCYTDKYYFIKSSGDEPVEATGAGDAFGSTFVAGMVMGKDVEYSLRMGQANAESVIMHHGAKNDLLTLPQLTKRIKELKSPLISKYI